MASQNGSNAYKLRYESGAAEKRVERQPARRERMPEQPRKHVRSNMTVKLNRKTETRPSIAPRSFAKKAKSLDRSQVRLVFAVGFIFSIVIAFFLFCVGCGVKAHELDHKIEEKKTVLAGLQNDYEGLVVKKDVQMSDTTLQAFAEQSLGMQKRDNHQLNWFEVGWENDFDD